MSRHHVLFLSVLLVVGTVLSAVVAPSGAQTREGAEVVRVPARERTAQPVAEEPETRVRTRDTPTLQLSPDQVQLRRGAAVRLSPEVVEDLERVQAAPLLVRRDETDRRTILSAELSSQRARPLYRTRRDLVYDLAVAPGNRYTAALESVDGQLETRELGEVEYVRPPRNELVVLDAKGGVVCRVLENVQRYSFGPDGDRLAYLVGSYYEGGVGFRPEGVFLLEIDGCRSRRIAASDVYEVAWSGSGRGATLHLRGLDPEPSRRVLRYDPPSRRLEPAPNGAFHVSGDGRFFLKRPHELMEQGECVLGRRGGGDCFAVYDAGSGRKVRHQPPAELGRPVGWAYGSGALLAFVDAGEERQTVERRLGRLSVRAWLPRESDDAQTRVWDVTQGKVVQRLAGVPLENRSLREWVASSGQLLVRPAAAVRAPSGRPAPPPEVRELQIALPPQTLRRLERDGGQ